MRKSILIFLFAVLLPSVHLLTGLGLMTLLALRDPLRDMLIAGTAVWG